jgi:tRNA(fMet)-specific endonuclease VapC
VGLIVDTSVLIDADRSGLNVAEMLERLPVERDAHAAISSITLMEFATGIASASTEERRDRRKRFADDLLSQMPVLTFGSDLAIRTGVLNGELRGRGVTVGSLDLMIGMTALVVGYSVVTRNVRHFRLIPGLDVVEM